MGTTTLWYNKQHYGTTCASPPLPPHYRTTEANIQIRAANLSGDCRWGREIERGRWAFSKQHQACVKRRAVLSVMQHPHCDGQEAAERAVNEVWESCFRDTRPFDEVSVELWVAIGASCACPWRGRSNGRQTWGSEPCWGKGVKRGLGGELADVRRSTRATNRLTHVSVPLSIGGGHFVRPGAVRQPGASVPPPSFTQTGREGKLVEAWESSAVQRIAKRPGTSSTSWLGLAMEAGL